MKYSDPTGDFNLRYCPKKACDKANRICKTHLLCGACGPNGTLIKPVPESCLPFGDLVLLQGRIQA